MGLEGFVQGLGNFAGEVGGSVRNAIDEQRRREESDRSFQIQREAADRAQQGWDFAMQGAQGERSAGSTMAGSSSALWATPNIPLLPDPDAVMASGNAQNQQPAMTPSGEPNSPAPASPSGAAPSGARVAPQDQGNGFGSREGMLFSKANSSRAMLEQVGQQVQAQIAQADPATRAALYQKFDPVMKGLQAQYVTDAQAANQERFRRYGKTIAYAMNTLGPQQTAAQYAPLIRALGGDPNALAQIQATTGPGGIKGFKYPNGSFLPSWAMTALESGELTPQEAHKLFDEQDKKGFDWNKLEQEHKNKIKESYASASAHAGAQYDLMKKKAADLGSALRSFDSFDQTKPQEWLAKHPAEAGIIASEMPTLAKGFFGPKATVGLMKDEFEHNLTNITRLLASPNADPGSIQRGIEALKVAGGYLGVPQQMLNSMVKISPDGRSFTSDAGTLSQIRSHLKSIGSTPSSSSPASTPAGGQARVPAPSSPKPSPPKVGDVVRGYKFNGGDPSSQANWSKVQ